jgi:predicted transposase/invertase (TIGR01784 family)
MSQIFYDVCNDIAFKKVFNNHANLTIKFLNATLRLEGDRAIREVQFLPQELLPNTSESKKSILDVRCTDQRGFQYIVEVQNKALQRVQYYVSHTYAGQLKTAQSYLELKPVTMLSILNHTLFPKEISFLSFHSNVELETQKSYLTDMSYAFIELPKFTKSWTELKAPEDYWVYLLKESRHMQEIPDEAPTEIKEALNLLEEHAWSGEEREAYLKAKMLVLDDQSALLTAKEEGKLEEKLEIAHKMLSKNTDIVTIVELTGLSIEKIETLKR